jgi:hypothetical protein
MILFQIDPQGLALFPLKGDAPRAVNMDTVPGGASLKNMEVEPRYM